MHNVNPAAVKQMAATCAALPMLLCGHRELRDLLVIGGTAFPEAQGDLLGRAVKQGRSVLIVTFTIHGPEAVIDKMLLFRPLRKKTQLSISYCKFVQSEDGKFALRSVDRTQPTECVFSPSSNRLIGRPVRNDETWAIAELNGLRALLDKASTSDCKESAYQVV